MSITDVQGQVHLLEGYSAHYNLMTKIEQLIGERVRLAVLYGVNNSNISFGLVLTTIDTSQYSFLTMFHCILKNDSSFSKAFFGYFNSKYVSGTIFNDWFEKTFNFPEEDVYEVVKRLATWKRTAPPNLINVFLDMNRKYHYFSKACSIGDKEVAEWAIRAGIDFGQYGIAALDAAWLAMQKDIIIVLLQNERFPFVKINKTLLHSRNKHNETLLHFIAETNNTVIALHLISSGVQINAFDASFETPLYRAVQANQTSLISLLLVAGANTSTCAATDSLLHVAARKGYVEATSLLLKHYENVDPKNKDGLTPLYLAEQAGFAIILNQLQAKCSPIVGDEKIVKLISEWRQMRSDKNVCLIEESDCNNQFGPLSLQQLDNYTNVTSLLMKRGAMSNISNEIRKILVDELIKSKIVQGVHFLLYTGI